MGRYDWEEKQRKREASFTPPSQLGRRLAFPAICLALIGLALATIALTRGSTVTGESHDKLVANTPQKSSLQIASRLADLNEEVESKPTQEEGKPAYSASRPQPSTAQQHRFARCGTVRETCVVDGDTIWLEGVKIRVADIDTPEISQPGCAYEKALGDKASDRLVVLLNEGPFEVSAIGDRDEDQFGRKLRVLLRDGKSLGDQLVSEGLARTWTGRREPWC